MWKTFPPFIHGLPMTLVQTEYGWNSPNFWWKVEESFSKEDVVTFWSILNFPHRKKNNFWKFLMSSGKNKTSCWRSCLWWCYFKSIWILENIIVVWSLVVLGWKASKFTRSSAAAFTSIENIQLNLVSDGQQLNTQLNTNGIFWKGGWG